MSRRTTNAYKAALQYVNENIIELKGNGIIIDFEKAMRAALRKVSPNIPILGCWFHFCQALRRKMASMEHLLALIKDNPDAKNIFRKFQCLALLPNDKIKDAFVYLLREALEEKKIKEFAPFISYFKKEWMEIVGPEYFSVFDKDVRTTGSAEAFNGKLNKKFRTHSSFLNFVESLQREELSKTDEFQRHILGIKQPDRRKKFYVRREEMIQELAEKLKNSKINYKHYLNTISNEENKILYGEDEIFYRDGENVRETDPEVFEQTAPSNSADNLQPDSVRKTFFSTFLNQYF